MKPYGTDNSKKQEVRDMFDAIAPVYDRLNHILSFNFDRLWRRKTVRMVTREAPSSILDMATGTGDLAAALARKNPEAAVTGIDLSPGMVRLGREKMVRKGLSERVRMEVGDGESLDIPDSAFDCATIAFGIRNYQDIPAGLREFFRVLRPGGKVFILEFSTPHGWFFGPLYRFYFHRILPVIGGLVSRDKAAYSYLPGSVGEFPEKELFLRMMSDSGLENVTAKRLMRGVAYIYSGRKPLDP